MSERTVAGLAVPFGSVGNTSIGPAVFAKGSITLPADITRVKLLANHNPQATLGSATSFEESDEGLHGAFKFGTHASAEDYWTQLVEGTLDAFSVGVRLDKETLDALMEWDGKEPINASGELQEVSTVSIPAFPDARTDHVSDSAKASVSEDGMLYAHFSKGFTINEKDNEMTEQVVTAEQNVTAQPSPSPVPPTGLQAAYVEDAPTYTLDGSGHSFVRDAFNARFMNDFEASQRLFKFNESLKAGSVSQTNLVQTVLTAAVETRTGHANVLPGTVYKPNLVEAIDKGRPLISRVGTVNITDATPYRLPVEGEFTGVATNTEGTNVADGSLTDGTVTVNPVAAAGKYRVSRELVDASNPAIDTLAVRAMARGYGAYTENLAVGALVEADGVATVSINTPLLVRGQINSYWDTIGGLAPTGVLMSSGFWGTIGNVADSTGRPVFSYDRMNSMSAGAPKPGYLGADIDGVELFKGRPVTNLSANDAWLFHSDYLHIAESATQTFRFEEVEGPGVIVLALWGYFAAESLMPSSVVKLTSAAVD